MTLDFSACRLPPFQHQREDTELFVQSPFFFITSEMRTGKTKIVIDGVQFLHEAGKLDKVIVIAPQPVAELAWFDSSLGQLARHLWSRTRADVISVHSKIRTWSHNDGHASGQPFLQWYITNFEFMRSKNRVEQLLPACGPRTLLVLDESSFVKNHAAAQTKACVRLRRACGRVVLITGTPIYHSPLDLFSQGNLLHPSILQCKYITHFKARYAIQVPVLGPGGKPLIDPYGKEIKKVKSWTNLDDLQRRFAPITVRRLQKDCLDLPPKLEPVTLAATFSPERWRQYRDMRDEFIIWLGSHVATSATAAIKSLRLSQITSGFVGGVENAGIDNDDLWSATDLSEGTGDILNGGDNGEDLPFPEARPASGSAASLQSNIRGNLQGDDAGAGAGAAGAEAGAAGADGGGGARLGKVIKLLGNEKREVLYWFMRERLEADPNLHIVVWSRFREEVRLLLEEVRTQFPQFETAAIWGQQKRNDRHRALSLLHPDTSPVGPVFVAGVEGTGSFGLDMTASHTCVTISCGYSPGLAAQTLDRVYGPNQKHPIAYYNIIATGPAGQKTIDHVVLAARTAGHDLATMTASAWVRALKEE